MPDGVMQIPENNMKPSSMWYSGDGKNTPLGYFGAGGPPQGTMQASVMPSISPNGPTLNDILARLDRPVNMGTLPSLRTPGADTNATFQRGIDAAAPSAGLSPGYQSILDTIRKQQDYATGVGTSAAQSLAAKRGLTGSSVEQFGTQQAIEAASRAGQDASSNVLLQNEAQNNALRQLQAQLYGTRANTLSQLGSTQDIAQLNAQNQANMTGAQIQGQSNIAGAQLSSDEIASLRNQDFSNRYLQLQQQLGQQGIDVSRENIAANKDIARQNAQNQLISTGLSGILGSGAMSNALGNLFPNLFGAGGGMPGFMGMGGQGGIPGLQGGTPLVNGAAAGGIGLIPGLGLMAGAGAGASLLASEGGKLAGPIGSVLANPIGAQINLAKDALSSGGNAISNVGKSIGNAVSNVFPF